MQITPPQFLSEQEILNFPVKHFSPSAIRSYLCNRQEFFRRYIRLEFDNETSEAMATGSLFHKALELYWRAISHLETAGENATQIKPVDFLKAIDAADIEKILEGLDMIEAETSREKILEVVEKSLGYYGEHIASQDLGRVHGAEVRMLEQPDDLDGHTLPIPLKGFLDLIMVKSGEEYILEDHKLVGKLTAEGTANPKYDIAAGFYFLGARKMLGKNPARMIFRETKKTKNKDGSSQCRAYVVEFSPEILEISLELYRRISYELAGRPLIDDTGVMRFLPNPFELFGGDKAWDDFVDEVVNARKWTLADIAEKLKKPEKAADFVEVADL